MLTGLLPGSKIKFVQTWNEPQILNIFELLGCQFSNLTLDFDLVLSQLGIGLNQTHHSWDLKCA